MATAHLTPRFFHCKNHAAILSLHDSFTARFFHRYEKAIHKAKINSLALLDDDNIEEDNELYESLMLYLYDESPILKRKYEHSHIHA